MPTQIHDRYLWLGFGLFFFFAAKGIRHAITNTVRLTGLNPIHTRNDDDSDSDQPEDRIALSTLKTLASSPNPNIASSAASLIVTRFAALPNAAELISADLYSKDDDVRAWAKRAIAYLQSWDTSLTTTLDETRTFATREALAEAARTLRSSHNSGIHLPTMAEMQSVANVAGGLVSLSDLEAEGERQRSEEMELWERHAPWDQHRPQPWEGDVVSRLEELAEQAEQAEIGWNGESRGSARFAGWDVIPAETGDVYRPRNRRREAVVVSTEDDHDVGAGGGAAGAGWRAMG